MAQVSIAGFKIGEALIYRDEPYLILSIRAKHLGRGGAIYRTKLKNIKSGATLEQAFRPTDKFVPVDLTLETMSFMYQTDDEAFFMNPRTYEQVSLPVENLGDFNRFLKEGEEYRIQFIDNQPIGLLPPPKIKRQVTYSPDAVAGNTATAASKKVIVEGNLEIETPLFIKVGDVIIIRTEDGGYVSKAQESK